MGTATRRAVVNPLQMKFKSRMGYGKEGGINETTPPTERIVLDENG